jgi:penicillin G amidase
MMSAAAACGGDDRPPPLPPARPPQVSGTLAVAGLAAPVTVVRDRHGIPHITAAGADDLFFAQGLVQAQDRLFQMDLWRRSVQGRLSEVLGANFLERDAMTRRIQYRGDVRADWASYGDDTERIAAAFVHGINAVVAEARVNPPDEFRLAGWLPEEWEPEDLLNRTHAFLATAGAHEEVLRARLIAALGVAQVDALWPLPGGQPTPVDSEVDLSVVGPVLANMLRRVGTRPFLAGFAGPLTLPARPGAPADAPLPVVPIAEVTTGGIAWAFAGNRTVTREPLLAAAPHRTFDNPSSRYLVHLTAPGWNVIGATSPWLPGVAIGHNDQVAWAMAPLGADVQDITIERLHPEDPHRVSRNGQWAAVDVQMERVAIKGRTEPFEFERQSTDRGVIIGVDRERGLAYALRWPGSEPGTALDLAALTLGRARSADEFDAALTRWKLPVAEFVTADRGGTVLHSNAGLVPRPRGGVLPSAGWRSSPPSGWIEVPRRTGPAARAESLAVASADGDSRLTVVESLSSLQSVASLQTLMGDVRALDADVLVPLLRTLSSSNPRVEDIRLRLLAWDRQWKIDSADALLYARWKQALRRGLATSRVPREFVDDMLRRVPMSAIARPTRAWFDAPVTRSRDALLLQALAEIASPGSETALTWGDSHRISFVHTLAISDAARRAFNVGPFSMAGGPDAFARVAEDLGAGSPFRLIVDLDDWDNAVSMNAPGQSGSPVSPHYADLAGEWAAGRYINLPFSGDAVRAATESTLTLTPK